MDLSIGDMARLTGLGVKTIRYYSDIGLVPETHRSPAGYRRYDEHGLARLELVRILRDLGSTSPAFALWSTNGQVSTILPPRMPTPSTCKFINSDCVGQCSGR